MKSYQVLMPLAAAVMISACGSRDVAQNAVEQADAQLAEVRPQAEKLAPQELQAADATLADMKANLERHKYSVVVKEIPHLNQQFKTIGDAIVTGETAQVAALNQWTELNQEIPKTVEAIDARLNGIDKAAMPKGMTKESIETAKTDLETLKTTWAEATAAANAGNTVEATDKGRVVQSKADELMTQLGISPTVASAG